MSKNRHQNILRKSAPLPPLAQNQNQIEELYAQHSISSSRGMQSLDIDGDPLINENKALEAKVSKLKEENQKIAAQNQKILMQNDSLVKNNKSLEAKLKEQEDKIQNLTEENEQINKNLMKLNMKLNKMPPNAEKTQKENELLKKQLEELKTEIKRKESQISESRLCLQTKENQIQETSRGKENITDKYKNIRAQNKELESKFSQLKAEYDQLLSSQQIQESILNDIKTEKDQIISDLTDKLTLSQTENNKSNQKATELSNEIDLLNDQLAKYQEMIKNSLNGIEETPKTIEERNRRRKEKKDKANQLFENFRKMKLHEKELTDKINEIQSDILIEENASRLKSSISATKSLKPKVEKQPEEANKNTNSSTQQQNATEPSDKINDIEKSETAENDNSASILNQLKFNCEELQKDLSEFIQKEEKMKIEMINFGIKPSSFDNIDEEWIEEEEESDLTFTEIRERVKRLRTARNEALSQMKSLNEENESLRNDINDKKLRIEKISEIVNSLVSQRIIKTAAPK